MALTLTEDDIAKIQTMIDNSLKKLSYGATDVTGLSESTDNAGSLLDVSSSELKKFAVKKNSITFSTDDTSVQVDILQ